MVYSNNSKRRQKVVYWPGTGNSNGLQPPFKALHDHIHRPNYNRLNHLKGDKLLVEPATNSNDKPRDIVNKVFRLYSKDKIVSSKSRNALKQKINRARKKQLGDVPVATTLEGIVIPESLN